MNQILETLGLDIEFLKGNGLVEVKGEVLDLTLLKSATENLLTDLAQNAGQLGMNRLQPIAAHVQTLVSKTIPKLGRYYAENMVRSAKDKNRRDVINQHVNSAVDEIDNQLRRVLPHVVGLEIANTVEDSVGEFIKVVRRVVPLFVNLSSVALSYIRDK